MKVSVIVPVYNDPRIESCIASLLEQDFPRELYELIVVDNGSNGSIKEIIHNFPVRYEQEEVRGSYFARNRGLKVARGEIAAFIDADCVADARWLSTLVSCFDDASVGGVGGKILKLTAETWVQRAAEDLAEQQLTPQSFPFLPYPYIVTANAAYRISVLRELEGFDTQFQSGGDVDMAQRVQGRGYRIITLPEAIVFHAPRSTFREYYKQFFGYAVGHTLLFKKYRKAMKMHIFVNIYPIQGFLSLIVKCAPPFLFFRLMGDSDGASLSKEFLQLLKYVALICGNLYGSVKHRVLFL
jgi:cellulose synthase/poly-beta-1,6-N-acetylglucosamine synthase-like glycosyltransferase